MVIFQRFFICLPEGIGSEWMWNKWWDFTNELNFSRHEKMSSPMKWSIYPLVICYSLLLKIAIEIVDYYPSRMVIFHTYVTVYQRVWDVNGCETHMMFPPKKSGKHVQMSNVFFYLWVDDCWQAVLLSGLLLYDDIQKHFWHSFKQKSVWDDPLIGRHHPKKIPKLVRKNRWSVKPWNNEIPSRCSFKNPPQTDSRHVFHHIQAKTGRVLKTRNPLFKGKHEESSVHDSSLVKSC